MKWLRRFARLFPFTPMGLALIIASGLAFWFLGYKRVDLIVLAISGITLGIAVLALVTTTITAIVIARTLRGAPATGGLRLECGFGTKTGFSVSTLWFVPLVFFRWKWASPAGEVELARQGGRSFETVTPHRRGFSDQIEREIEVSDAFRLTKITLQHAEKKDVRCLPSVGLLKRMNVVQSITSGDALPDPKAPAEGDRSDLRRYAPGDPVRFILWRVFAKTREVVIKTPERAVSAATKTSAYLVAGPGDEAAAGAARMAIESGTLGNDWTFGVDGADKIATTADSALQLIASSAGSSESVAGAGLDGFLKRQGTNAGRVLVFVPAIEGPWLERVASVAKQRSSAGTGTRIEILVCCDGIDRTAASSWLRRIMLASPERDLAKQKRLEIPTLASSTAVLKALVSTRARVLLVDRHAGRVHEGNQQLRLVLDAKPVGNAPPVPTEGAA